LENWNRIEFLFAKNLNIHPLLLDEMEFYRIEYLLQNYEEFIKEENKQYKNQQKEQNKQMGSSKYSPPSINYGGFKTPKLNIPKMNIPKM